MKFHCISHECKRTIGEMHIDCMTLNNVEMCAQQIAAALGVSFKTSSTCSITSPKPSTVEKLIELNNINEKAVSRSAAGEPPWRNVWNQSWTRVERTQGAFKTSNSRRHP